jgi:hypothetical protein
VFFPLRPIVCGQRVERVASLMRLKTCVNSIGHQASAFVMDELRKPVRTGNLRATSRAGYEGVI